MVRSIVIIEHLNSSMYIFGSYYMRHHKAQLYLRRHLHLYHQLPLMLIGQFLDKYRILHQC